MSVIVRMLLAWFNDGKRITAIVLIVMQYLAKWAESKGWSLPPGLAESSAGYIAAAVLTALSKADVRVAVPAK